jgi:hypothetical protein
MLSDYGDDLYFVSSFLSHMDYEQFQLVLVHTAQEVTLCKLFLQKIPPENFLTYDPANTNVFFLNI